MMDMKKVMRSKPFIAGALGILCVSILAICFVAGRSNEPEFVVEDTTIAEAGSTWESATGKMTATGETQKTAREETTGTGETEASGENAYPKVVEETEKETVIDFTQPMEKKQETAPTATSKSETSAQTDPAVTTSPPETVAPAEESTKPPSDSPSDSGKPGQVYDPAFGWIDTAEVEHSVVDGEGDMNNIIGEMD